MKAYGGKLGFALFVCRIRRLTESNSCGLKGADNDLDLNEGESFKGKLTMVVGNNKMVPPLVEETQRSIKSMLLNENPIKT